MTCGAQAPPPAESLVYANYKTDLSFKNQSLRFLCSSVFQLFSSGVSALGFLHRLGWARPFVLWTFGTDHMLLKIVGDGWIQVAANCVGDLGNILAGCLLALLRPNGHFQDIALAMWVRTLL